MNMLHNTMLKRQRTLELYLVISSDALHICPGHFFPENIKILKKENQYDPHYLHPTDGNPVSVSQPIDSPQEDSIGHVCHNAHITPLRHVKKIKINRRIERQQQINPTGKSRPITLTLSV